MKVEANGVVCGLGDTRLCTVKTYGLLPPYFGHLSCIPVVYVKHYIHFMKCS